MNQNSASKPRLLFVCLQQNSFVKDDLRLLRERYDVQLFQFDAHAESTTLRRGLRTLALAGRQWKWLRQEIESADLVYGWFADYHMALPLILARANNVPTVIMLGGMDCNHHSELGYGLWESSWRAPIARLILPQAKLLLASSERQLTSRSQYTRWPAIHTDGLFEHIRPESVRTRIIPLGFDADAWQMGASGREASVTSVAYLSSHAKVRLKGIDLLLDAARLLPEVPFQIVGIDPMYEADFQAAFAPPDNVQLGGPLPRGDLQPIYSKTAVYAQLSRIESFGMVVGEAMLCGALPVVSDVGELPSLAGGCGEVIRRPQPESIAAAIQRALRAPEERREAARRHIQENYALSTRRRDLLATLDEVRSSAK